MFHQDEDNEEDWYIEVVKEKGFPVRHKEGTDYLSLNKVAVCKQIYDSLAYEKQCGKCLIAGVPMMQDKRKLWAILTTSLKND